ncbi:5-hydroxyisourate hydrolase-like protein (transthyretin family) [Nocardioides marinisabuli]|uniref:5-hydroxyisourate hydrolase-like protein (Transthyretin family) n=1 Tax=Nocardioides marinisabuli TaxID=419476 RepID=A0A7Y9JRD9_9ACTN|nr:hypothetical protein [Nocardioides marinisabuli]NYD57473.1 5-hydroxyisourate hydrolase-like protein (transthyretin family) [Nocardioides marinisabuli]
MQTTRLRRAGIAAVATAALVVPLAQATGAQQPTGARAPAVGETGRSIIHGQVVDSRTGKPLDDVHVEAVRVTARGEEVAASDLSYASPDNAITHGYFAMHVQRGGYRVTFDRPDYATTRVEVEKGQRDRAGLGSPVDLVRLPATRISLSAIRGRGLSVRTGRRIELDLRLRGKGARTSPTGTVAVSLERRSSAVAPRRCCGVATGVAAPSTWAAPPRLGATTSSCRTPATQPTAAPSRPSPCAW